MRSYYLLLILANVVFIPMLMLYPKTRHTLMRTRGLWLAPLICLPVFLVWDFIGVNLGWWGFNSDYLSGAKLLHVPAEEVLFLYLIPLASLFIWILLRPPRPN